MLGSCPESSPDALMRLCLHGVLKEFLLNLTKTSLGNTSVACRPWGAIADHPADQESALPAKNEGLPAIYKALPAPDVLGHQAAAEHKIQKMEGLPRVCTHYATPYHFKNIKGEA